MSKRKQTEALSLYEEMARDLEREVRRALVNTMEEEAAIAKAEGRSTNDLVSKYDMTNVGGPRG